MATVAQNITDLYGPQSAAREAQVQATQRPTVAPAPAARPALQAEAAFSLCLKGRLDGQDAQLTIRGGTYQEFAANVAAVRGLLDPTTPPAFSPASPPAAASPAAAEPKPEGWCGVHEVQMTLQKARDGGKGWWSHKTEGGAWCKGRR